MKQMIAWLLLALVVVGADMSLPRPALQGGMSLQQALAMRKSGRNFSPARLSPEVLSGLLWAANGINRQDGHRTAPTGMNVQDISVYVILDQGVFVYAAEQNKLIQVRQGDFRHAAGKQEFVWQAPVNLIYVQDVSRAMKGDPATQARHGGIHTGAIMQNVYLYCAANGLISVARDFINREELTRVLGLRPQQKIMLAQSVGYATDGVKPAPVPPQTTPANPRGQNGMIPASEAQRIALEAARVPRNVKLFVKNKLKQKYGQTYYEVEFKFNGMEYEYKIDARNGRILEVERERD